MTGLFAPMQAYNAQTALASAQQLNMTPIYGLIQNLTALRLLAENNDFTDDASFNIKINEEVQRLGHNLQQLPEWMLPEYIRSQLDALPTDPEERQTFIEQVEGLVARDNWFHKRARGESVRGTELLETDPAASPERERPPFIPRAYKTEVPVQSEDHERIRLSGYRIGEEYALYRALHPDSPYKLVNLASFTGGGVSSHIVPQVVRLLRREGLRVREITLSAPNQGPGLVRAETRDRVDTADVMIIDDVQVLPSNKYDELARGLSRFFSKDTEQDRSVLIIGGHKFLPSAPDDQLFHLHDITNNTTGRHIANDDERLDVIFAPKPLNRRQSQRVLTQRAGHLSSADKYRYTDFVLARIAPYLSLLREYTLSDQIKSLEDGLVLFANLFGDQERLARALRRASIFPGTGNHVDPFTQSLQALRRGVVGDVKKYLDELAE